MAAAWETWREPARAERLARTPIAVLMGGASDEREVSLTSGRAVVASLRDLSGPSREVAPPVFEIDLRADGDWGLDGAALAPSRVVEALPEDTAFLLALHGGSGEDGRVQGFLETCGRRHTGAGPQTSALCMDKHRSRLVASEAGVRVAQGAHVTSRTFLADPDAAGQRLLGVKATLRFVKLATGGSSIGVHRCTSGDEVLAAAADVARRGGDVLVEEGVVGLETTVGLIGDGAAATALPVVEIEPRGGAFFDLEQKYAATGGAVESCPPRHLSDALSDRLQARARTAWEAFGGTGYARIDFMVPAHRKKDGTWSFEDDVEPVLLEANTLPGFTPRSLLPLAAAAEGVGFRELCLELVTRALAD